MDKCLNGTRVSLSLCGMLFASLGDVSLVTLLQEVLSHMSYAFVEAVRFFFDVHPCAFLTGESVGFLHFTSYRPRRRLIGYRERLLGHNGPTRGLRHDSS